MNGESGELAIRPREVAPETVPVAPVPPAPVSLTPAPHTPADMFVIQVAQQPNGAVHRASIQTLPAVRNDRAIMPVGGDLSVYLPPSYSSEIILSTHPSLRSPRAPWPILPTVIIGLVLGAIIIAVPLMRKELADRTSIAESQSRVAQEWQDQDERDSHSLQKTRDQLGVAKRQNDFLMQELASTDDLSKKAQTQLSFHEQAIAVSKQDDQKKAFESTGALIHAMEAAQTPDRLEIIRALAHRELMRGDYPVALLCYRRAIEWGGDSLAVRADALEGLSLAYEKQNQFSEARDAYQDLVDIDRRRGDSSNSAMIHLSQLALMSLRIKGSDESTDQAARAIDRLMTYLDSDAVKSAPDWHGRLVQLADAALARNLDGIAARLLERSGTVSDEVGAGDPMLVNLYIGVGRLDDARRILLRSLPRDFLDPTYTSNDPKIATSAVQLAQIEEKQNDLRSAETMLKTALRIRERALGENHPDVADTMYSLSRIYDRQGRHSEADALRTSANEIWTKHPDPAAR